MEQVWLTKKEVCNILGIQLITLDRMMAKKKITYYKNGTEKCARVKFLKSDVDKILKNMKVN